MKKAILLCRVSTPKQSLDEMERELYAWAVRDGYADNEEHIIAISKHESGIKLDEEEREGLIEMKQHIENDAEIDCVYVWEVSRIARRKKILFSVLEYLRDRGIQLKIMKPELKLFNEDKTLNEAAETVFTLYAQIAESEMRNKKARFSRGKKEGAAHNRYTGGHIPFGYCVNQQTKQIEVCEEEAKIVRDIFQEYANGMSMLQIAKLHQSLGQTKITMSRVHNLLIQRLYTGEPSEEHEIVQKVRGEERKWISYSRAYYPIISKDLFERCREIAKTNSTNVDKSKYVFFANRLIRCPQCGCFYRGSSRGDYFCTDFRNVQKQYNGYAADSRCNNGMSISVNVLDSLLWFVAIQLETKYILSVASAEKTNYEGQIQILGRKIEAIQPRLEHLDVKLEKAQDLYFDGKSKEWYESKKIEIGKERSAILDEQKQYEEQINHLNTLIEGIVCRFDDNGSAILANAITNIATVYQRVASIENEVNRKEIIHKHIKKVEISSSSFNIKYSRLSKETEGKLIIIECYNGDVLKYGYTPWLGKGKGYVVISEDESTEQITIPYLNRFFNKRKKEVNKIKGQKNREETLAKKQKRQQSYMTITEVATKLNINKRKVAYDIEQGHLKAEQQSNRQHYIPIEEFDNYLRWIEQRNNSTYRGKRKNVTKAE